MAVNTMTFNQLATVLNSIVTQATGQQVITPTDTASFVSVAKLGLEGGYDPLLNAISQVLSKTIFSVRPYERKFSGLMADATRYGNHVRKINYVDTGFEQDDRLTLVDGQSVDQYKVNKPKVLQTNFYGENVYQKSVTIFRDQLDVAFSSPEEFGRFIANLMTHISNEIEQAHEETARMALANFIAGKTEADATGVVYLLDVYQDETGINLTATTVKDPANFAPFAKWLYGYIMTQSNLLTNRSVKFHQNFTIGGQLKPIARHTPLANQKVYLYSKDINNINSNVLSGVFNDKYMKLVDHELVDFWQAVDTPQGIDVTAGYTNSTGAATSKAVTLSNVFGVIFDEEACGYTMINEWSAPTPFNARGGYSNIFYHFTDRYWNDFTENAIVMILDHQ